MVRFLREHRSEWADFSVDAYAAASLRGDSFALPGLSPSQFSGNQTTMSLGITAENEVCSLLEFYVSLSGQSMKIQ